MIFFEPSQRHPTQAVPSDAVTESANVSQLATMKPLEAIRCTHPTCPCECFAPGKQSLRYCDSCNHGWVAHALDKLGTNHIMNLGLQVEVVQPNIVFDIASLMLYGAHATPVRLKILLDRLFSVLQHEEVLQVLHGFGWTYEDYARGYILQDSSGRVLDKWCVATREEEMVVLQQFLRFGETKSIAQEIILQDTKDRHDVLVKQPSRAESDIKKFIERSNLSMQNYIKSYESTRQLFGSRAVPFIPPGTRIMTSPLISPNYTQSRESRAMTLPQTPTTTATPLTTPPLNRLQVMQPFDARKEQTSPAVSLSPGAMDKSMAGRSPICDSPKNLSTTPTVVSSAAASPSHQALQQQQQQQQQQQGMDEVDGADPYPSGSDEEGEILDFSNKDNPDSPSDPDKKNKQHMRKSSNPIKRQWTPSANFGSTLVGPNGKKRVLCTACNKTFCDKGALKIHYSAVHLKEMHKCTVEGCNMMFSSRRSRNRHSANPNPKLHMPQKRKDELDQGEEVDLSTSSGTATPTASTTPTISVPTPPSVSAIPTQVLPILEAPRIIRPDSSFFIEMSAQFPFLPPPEKRAKLEDEQPTDLSKITTNINNDDEPCDLSKKFDGERKLEIDLDASNDEKEDAKKEDECEVDENGTKNDGGVRGGKRRKNTAPTRYAQGGDNQTASDDNCDDKDPQIKPASGLGFPDNTVVENITAVQPLTGNGDGSQGNSATDYNDVDENSRDEQSAEACPQTGLDKKQDGSEAKNFPKIASLLWAGGVNVEPASNAEDAAISGEPEDADSGKDDESAQEDDQEGDVEDVSGKDSSEEGESVSVNDMMQDYPPEVYLDKENPLKCKLCGKAFQNTFTIKIHFQNVHLKVMHPCTVDGCTATFPSKRSRDRHSANLNLHRRLLAGENISAEEEMDDNLRGDILAKLYGCDLVGAKAVPKDVPTISITTDEDTEMTHANNNNNNEDLKCGQDETPANGINTSKVVSVPTSSPLKITVQHGVNGHVSKPGSTGSEAVSDDSEVEGENVDKDEFLSNESLKIPCKVCGEKFSSPVVLQEHISISHPDHDLSLPDPVARKAVSPRRVRSRQKVRVGVTTRKSNSL